MCNKAQTLANDFGYATPLDLIDDYMFEGIMPAICTNDDCDYSTDMEPDQDQGWCEHCCTNTVVSMEILIL